jgi:pectin methylesterase-like acyl-CoA thioesterase
MKKLFLLILLASLILSFSVPRVFAQADDTASKAPNILVDKDKVQCPTAAYTSIQAAVNAVKAGDVIRVCADTYPEQVVINKSLVLEADNGVVVSPVAVTANATGPTGDPIAAIIFVENATNV